MSLIRYRKRAGYVGALVGGAGYAYKNRGLIMDAGRYARRKYDQWRRPSVPRNRMSRRGGSLPLAGFPASKKVRFRYVDRITINPSAGALAQYTFLANGLFAPNQTGSTHQPLGFDQWMLAYDHFTVLGSKMTIRYVNTTATNQIPAAFGVILDDNATMTYTDYAAILEGNQKNSKFAVSGGLGGDNFKRPQLSLGFSAKRFFGTKNIVGKAEYKGDTSADPAEKAYYQIWAQAPDASGDPAISTFLVTIDYIAVLTEKKHLAQS